MREAKSRDEVQEIAKQYDSKLLATDPRFRRTSIIIDEEGSTFQIKNAFLVGCSNHIILFSEHQGTMIFHRDELYSYGQFEEVRPLEELE
jgi:hypothetical protein